MAERIYGTHHIGVTVPNIEEAIAFFEAVFGAVTVFRTGPYDVDEAFMQRKLGAAPHTRIRDLVFLRCGDGPSVELFEYSGEDSTARPKRVSEVGGMHLCFEVDDVFCFRRAAAGQGHRISRGSQHYRRGAASRLQLDLSQYALGPVVGNRELFLARLRNEHAATAVASEVIGCGRPTGFSVGACGGRRPGMRGTIWHLMKRLMNVPRCLARRIFLRRLGIGRRAEGSLRDGARARTA